MLLPIVSAPSDPSETGVPDIVIANPPGKKVRRVVPKVTVVSIVLEPIEYVGKLAFEKLGTYDVAGCLPWVLVVVEQSTVVYATTSSVVYWTPGRLEKAAST